MTGLGNDLIALKTTDAARTKSPRFYTKILAGTEQQLYQTGSLLLSHLNILYGYYGRLRNRPTRPCNATSPIWFLRQPKLK
jgi:hypothetical protein